MLTGILFFVVGLTKVHTVKNFIMLLIFVVLPFLIPFGYFLGLKTLIRTLGKINRVKKGDYIILKKKCIDKRVVNNEDSTRDTQIIFSDDDGVWVGRDKSKEIPVGAFCYTFYYEEGDEYPFMLYNVKKVDLDNEMLSKVKDVSKDGIEYVQSILDKYKGVPEEEIPEEDLAIVLEHKDRELE